MPCTILYSCVLTTTAEFAVQGRSPPSAQSCEMAEEVLLRARQLVVGGDEADLTHRDSIASHVRAVLCDSPALLPACICVCMCVCARSCCDLTRRPAIPPPSASAVACRSCRTTGQVTCVSVYRIDLSQLLQRERTARGQLQLQLLPEYAQGRLHRCALLERSNLVRQISMYVCMYVL